MSIEAQAEMAEAFVKGVVERFGFTSARTTVTIADDAINVAVDGDNLGLLIGSRGSTVDALQELTRTVVQRRSDEHGSRLHVDVGGYRARRTAALQEFARRIAAEVLESGEAQALDPMSAADRKVVHDAINEVGGVATSSEGEEPRRFVVVSPLREAAATAEDLDDLADDDDLDQTDDIDQTDDEAELDEVEEAAELDEVSEGDGEVEPAEVADADGEVEPAEDADAD